MDCKFHIQLVEDGNYDETMGTWNGMVGEVINERVDMAVADLSIISAREKAVDFTVPFLHTGISILYKNTGVLTISSLDDLLRQDKIKFGCERRGFTPTFFRNSKVPTNQKIWQAILEQESLASNFISGVQKVVDGGGDYAFMSDNPRMEFLADKHCQKGLVSVGHGVARVEGYGIVLPQGSPYREDLNLAILELQEEGELDRIKSKWWRGNREKGLCQFQAEENGLPWWTNWPWNLVEYLSL
eukprot:GFUD01056960.1.p1 GENE.GFUD01056960.1~~GFUD01056960.1.p1  ORF type:complete len:281 (-),score=93.22 GFUD01056960.1:210-938(-)